MSAGVKDKKRHGLLEMYESSLQQRIQQGDWNLVCRDEELCREVEALLSTGAAHVTHSSLGLDPLSVMEASLQAFTNISRQTGLERLAKAFEVLELAALNLYMCPWRKEYRVVKMFSGMFTHYVKPALTLQQAEELFRLLGYQPAGASEEEELRLASKPVHADSLLQLACAFFAARVECRLLLSCVAPWGSCVAWELQLVRERKLGHSLQAAQESAKKKLESAPQSSEHHANIEVDLYTDAHQNHGEQAETNHMTAPPNSCYTPPRETPVSARAAPQPKHENENNTSKAQTVCISTMTYQINPMSSQKTEMNPKPSSVGSAQISASKVKVEPLVCSCFEPYSQYAHLCVQCDAIHNLRCPCFIRCQEQGHDLRQQHQSAAHSSQDWGKKPKSNLENHSCMNNSTSSVFCVCYSCHNIHDFECNELANCEFLRHNLQNTGQIQPAQGEWDRTASPQRHECLRAEDPPYVVCYTCNKSHDCLCKQGQSCVTLAHSVKYLVEIRKDEEEHASSNPITLHNCCVSTRPCVVCHTCRVFHGATCDTQCFKNHSVQTLKSSCSVCTQKNVHTLCRYCCALYCKKCWFVSPLDCKCGKPFDLSSPV